MSRLRPLRHDGVRASAGGRCRGAAAVITTILGAAVLLAACGSSTTGSHASGSDSATVKLGTVAGYGSVLVTAAGRPVYMLSADPAGSSRCRGSCARTWSPLTVSGSPRAGSGVRAALLSTFTRGDGVSQVAYGTHALYTHAGSAASAAGTAADGGVWYLVNAKGDAVKSTTSGGY